MKHLETLLEEQKKWERRDEKYETWGDQRDNGARFKKKGGKGGPKHENELRTPKKEEEKEGKSEGGKKGTDTQRKPYQVVWFPCAAGRPWRSPPSAGHLDCRELLDLLWMEEETEGGRDRGMWGRGWSGQLVLLIKAQWPKRDHLLAGARTGSPPLSFNVILLCCLSSRLSTVSPW